MKKIEKYSFWLLLLMTFVYSISQADENNLGMKLAYAFGYTIAFLLVSGAITLVVTLISMIFTKFRWKLVSKFFVIIWLILLILSFFSIENRIFSQQNNKKEFDKHFEKYLTESLEFRRMYYDKLKNVNEITIMEIKDYKNLELLKNLNNTIDLQESIEKWRYNYGFDLINRWQSFFENNYNELLQENPDYYYFIKDSRKNLQQIQEKQKNYFTSYSDFINFIIDENSNLTVEGEGLYFNDKKLLTKFNLLYSNLAISHQQYINLTQELIKSKSDKILEYNKIFKNERIVSLMQSFDTF